MRYEQYEEELKYMENRYDELVKIETDHLCEFKLWAIENNWLSIPKGVRRMMLRGESQTEKMIEEYCLMIEKIQEEKS